MNAKELKAEIDARTARLAPQLQELEALKRQHDDAVSREWIAANKVTAAQVRRSDGADVPWFGTVTEFGRWMKATGCAAPWAEWNGRIYASAELMAGRMNREAPGLAEHVAA
jgi:predicted phosphatase